MELLSAELSNLRDFIASSAAHSAAGLAVMPVAVSSSCEGSMSDKGKSPARIKREAISRMSDEEILEQVLRGIDEKVDPPPQWHGGPPLKTKVDHTAVSVVA